MCESWSHGLWYQPVTALPSNTVLLNQEEFAAAIIFTSGLSDFKVGNAAIKELFKSVWKLFACCNQSHCLCWPEKKSQWAQCSKLWKHNPLIFVVVVVVPNLSRCNHKFEILHHWHNELLQKLICVGYFHLYLTLWVAKIWPPKNRASTEMLSVASLIWAAWLFTSHSSCPFLLVCWFQLLLDPISQSLPTYLIDSHASKPGLGLNSPIPAPLNHPWPAHFPKQKHTHIHTLKSSDIIRSTL